jgi:hypothetical protein
VKDLLQKLVELKSKIKQERFRVSELKDK